MTITPATTDRPRPGPIATLAALGAASLAVVGLFVVAMAWGATRVAAALLTLPPLVVMAARFSRVGRYVERHAGLGASAQTASAVWAAGLAAVFAVSDPPGPVWIAAAIAAVASAVAAIERILWARHPPALDAAGLPLVDAEQRRMRWFDRTSRPFRRFEGALGTAALLLQLTTALVLAAGPSSGAAVGAAGLLLAVSLVQAGFAAGAAFVRLRFGDRALRARLGADVEALAPEVLVHFSGSIRTAYQLDQWMPYVVSSGMRTLVVYRERATFDALARRWDVPAVFIGDFPDLDLVVPATARVALYVNTGTKNNQLVRFDRLTHVQLHHGDSDKPPSSGKTMRLYDHHIVAGPAAVERLIAAGAVRGDDDVTMVGRPVTDGLTAGELDHERPRILYAPTWEGYHLDTALSSLAVTAEYLAAAMPPTVDLVVRPHPLTGTVDRTLRTKLRALRAAVEARGAGSRYVSPDDGPALIELMRDADVLICDVSSVLVDFLATDRPVIVCDVNDLGPDELARLFPSTTAALVLRRDAANLQALLDDALGPDTSRPARKAARDRLLARVGDAEEAFHAALARLAASARR